MSNTVLQQRSSLSSRVAWLTLANIASFAISFLAPLIIVRLLDPTQFGTYKQVFQILGTLMGMLYLQLPPTIYFFSEQEPGKRLQIAVNVIVFYLLIGGLVAVAFAVYPDWALRAFHNPEIVSYIPLLGFTLVFWLASNNLEVIPISNHDTRLASVIMVSSQLIKSLFIVGAALVFQNLSAILYASMAAGVMQLLFILTYIHFKIGSLWRPPSQLFDWPLFKKQIANSLPFAGGGFAANVQTEMHNYFVSYYFSPAIFAVYSNGCFQLPLLTMLQSAFREAISPDVAQLGASGELQEMRRGWLTAMRKLAFFIFPAFALLFVLRHELITTLFTATYADSVPIYSVYVINILFLTLIFSPYIRLFPEFRRFFPYFQALLVPITAGAIYVGIQRWGLIGAVGATVAVQLLSQTVYFYKISRRVGLTWQDLKLLRPVAAIALATVVAGSAAALLRDAVAFLHPILLLAVCGAGFVIVYAIAALLSGALPAEERTMLVAKARSLLRMQPRAGALDKPARTLPAEP
jgi:O-antigen/teichoic acid export membrane protein